jgi:adenine phosphoribosyltransferase
MDHVATRIGGQVDLKAYIRDVPDFPQPGILFRDVTPLLREPKAFKYAIDCFRDYYQDAGLDAIAAIEARGFLFGAPLAYQLGKPFVPVRKPGKLPAEIHSTEYTLEYGSNAIEVHIDGIRPRDRILVFDDLLATGGTLAAAARLVEMADGIVAGISVLIELTELDGRHLLKGYDLFSLLQY